MKEENTQYTEDDVFYYFDNLFEFDKMDDMQNMKIKSNTPFNSIKSHRFLYIIDDD